MEVVLHRSASKFGNAVLIAQWHLEKGWRTIGYHIVILNGWISSRVFNPLWDGNIETGRPFDTNSTITGEEIGAHTYGNNKTIGICLIADAGQEITEQQELSLHRVLEDMKAQFGSLDISQHSDHDDKKPHCAGLHPRFIERLNHLYN